MQAREDLVQAVALRPQAGDVLLQVGDPLAQIEVFADLVLRGLVRPDVGHGIQRIMPATARTN